MKFEAVTIKDIAKELGLSTSTVSRALRDSYEISQDTKKIVLECATRLQYRPNPIALSLKEKRSRSIGIIVCEIANSFFSQAINGIESVAYTKGYNIIISQSHENYEREVTDLDFLASRSVDGLIISVSAETQNFDHLSRLQNRGFPIVLFDRINEDMATHKVSVNNFKGAYDGTMHLLQGGFSKIACLVNPSHLSITKERKAGYRQALLDGGAAYNPDYIKYCKHGGVVYEEVEVAVNELLALANKPTAILGLSDKLTVGALKALQHRGIKVPEDMALLGFSNSEMTELTDPALTIIRQPAFDMGALATQRLISIIESKRPTTEFVKEVLDPELIIRKSSVRSPENVAF